MSAESPSPHPVDPEVTELAAELLADDLTLVLDYYERDYCPPRLAFPIRRLRMLASYLNEDPHLSPESAHCVELVRRCPHGQ